LRGQRTPSPRLCRGCLTTENGIVALSGELDNLAAKNHADMEAKKIKGVLGVLNKLVVEPSWRSDTDIRHVVRRRILNSAVIESEGIRVSSVDGKVTLSGEVASWTERKEAGLLASEVRGVKEVQNRITIQWRKTERSDQEIKNDVVATLERDVYLSGLPITVSVKDGVVTLTGGACSPAVFENIRELGVCKSVRVQSNLDQCGS